MEDGLGATPICVENNGMSAEVSICTTQDTAGEQLCYDIYPDSDVCAGSMEPATGDGEGGLEEGAECVAPQEREPNPCKEGPSPLPTGRAP